MVGKVFREERSIVKKKSSRKPKLPKKPTTVAEECGEYRASISEHCCEIETYLRKHEPAKEWMQKAVESSPRLNRDMEIHHLFGRTGNKPEQHWFCSLIQISGVCHKYCHDVNKHQVEVASLFSKLARQERYRELSEAGIIPVETNPSRFIINIPAMDEACPQPTLIGRIEGILIPSVSGMIFEKMANQFVRYIRSQQS